MNSEIYHDKKRMLKRFYEIYLYCNNNNQKTFQLPIQSYREYTPSEQTAIKYDFDDMVKYKLLEGYHRNIATPFSFMITDIGENVGAELDAQAIDIVAKKFD